MTKAELEKQVKENQAFIDKLLILTKEQNNVIDIIVDRVIEIINKLNKSGGSK